MNPSSLKIEDVCPGQGYTLIRSRRRRTVAIHIDQKAQVKVYAPWFVPETRVRQFVEDKNEWVRTKTQEILRQKALLDQRGFKHGNKFLFLGAKYPLCFVEKQGAPSRLVFDEKCWFYYHPSGVSGIDAISGEIKKHFIAWYSEQAKELLASRVFHYCRLMGEETREVVIKGPKSIWGSCHHRKKVITLNWKIMMSPLEVIDYVVVHELCHLKVPNHSQQFWREVQKVLPDYKIRRLWLRKNALEMALP